MISSFVRALISAFKARRELALENVALRQQLAVLRRSVKRPRLSKADRGFWVLLRRIWTDWESVLVIVKPETVIRWLCRCLRCLLLVMCMYPFAKKALTLHLARGEGRKRYYGCNLVQCKVLASSRQHLIAEAPDRGRNPGACAVYCW